MNVEQGTPKECAAQVAQFAAEAFASHRLTVTTPGEWMCKRPGTVMYSFGVLLRPGMLVFWGDLGESILRFSDSDSLRWLREAVKSPSYLFEKIAAACRREVFYIGTAVEVAKETGDAGFIDEVTSLVRRHELHEHSWGAALAEFDIHPELYTSAVGPSARMFWMLEALRWFVANVDGKAVTP